MTAAAALEGIKGLRFVIGDTANTKAFAIILSRRLGLEPMAINEASFRAPPVHQVSPRGELLRLMRAANAEDIALIDGLHELRDEKRPVVRIRGERGNRPNKPGRAERQARADRPKRKDGADPLTRGERPRRRKPKAADPEAQD